MSLSLSLSLPPNTAFCAGYHFKTGLIHRFSFARNQPLFSGLSYLEKESALGDTVLDLAVCERA